MGNGALEAASGNATAVASLGGRASAFLADYVVIFGYLVLLRALAAVFPSVRSWFASESSAHASAFLFLTLPVCAYFFLCEGSKFGATVGKRLLHIRVVNPSGEPLGFTRSMIRTVVKFTPWELSHTALWRIHFGVPLAAGSAAFWFLVATWSLILVYGATLIFNRRHRALYDLIAGSEVVRNP